MVLAMRPPQLDAALRDLGFRSDQIVVSCVAATPLEELASRVAPARVCRLIPLPTIARREGPLVLYPALPEIRDLLAHQGDLIVPPDETALAAYVAGSAAMSTILAMQDTIATWIASRGATPDGADAYVRSLFRALSETAVRTDPGARDDLVARHETPGGLNARVRGSLAAEGWFDALGAAFDRIAALGPADLGTGADGRPTVLIRSDRVTPGDDS